MSLEQDIQQKTFRSEYQKVLINLMFSNNYLVNHLNDFFKQFDITRQQYNVLRILRGQSPEPATVQLIRERMLDKMSDASRIVERLRLKQLVNRELSDQDKRTVKVTITDKGRQLLDAIETEVLEMERQVRKLTEEEARLFNQLLDKIRS